MLRLFEGFGIVGVGVFRGSGRVARGVVVKRAGMERSQFLEGRSAPGSLRGANLVIGCLNTGLSRENSAIFGAELPQSAAQRQFPRLNGRGLIEARRQWTGRRR